MLLCIIVFVVVLFVQNPFLKAGNQESQKEAVVQDQSVAENPFFKPYDTPFGLPPFDQIRNEHFSPAFKK